MYYNRVLQFTSPNKLKIFGSYIEKNHLLKIANIDFDKGKKRPQ